MDGWIWGINGKPRGTALACSNYLYLTDMCRADDSNDVKRTVNEPPPPLYCWHLPLFSNFWSTKTNGTNTLVGKIH